MTRIKQLRVYCALIVCYFYVLNVILTTFAKNQRNNRRRMIEHEISSSSTRRRKQHEYIHRLVFESDIKCIDMLRMDRRCFQNLCQLLTTTGGLRGTLNVGVHEMIAVFLNIIAHHVKNRVIQFAFLRSGETVSRHFHAVLKSVILCHSVLLKAVPNIESRIKIFRSKTTAIADILQISGFVWNFEMCTIECEKSAYDEYVKNHKEAAGLYGKAFPFFNDLVAVFARDRAQGSARGDIGDDAEQYSHENVTLDEDTRFFQFGSDDAPMDTQEPIPAPSPIGSETSTARARRKRKSVVDQSVEKISQNLDNFVEVIGPGFKTLADAAAREVDRDEAREAREKAREAREEAREAREKAREDVVAEIVKMKNMLPQVLFQIDGLSADEAMFILQVLPKDDDQMKIFFGLPDNMKLRFCHVFLARLSFRAPNM